MPIITRQSLGSGKRLRECQEHLLGGSGGNGKLSGTWKELYDY